MTIELGRYGAWQRISDATPERAAEIERLGYTTLWVGGSPGGDLAAVETLLDSTEQIAVATGIVNMWRDDADTIAAAYHRIDARHPERLLLGVGIGHPESTSEYRHPYQTMRDYIARLAGLDVPADEMILAALGPRALRLAAESTSGTHPYFTTPRHTRMARDLIGPGVVVAPEQTVVLGVDRSEGTRLARSFAARYLGLVNYRNSLLREGWDESDVSSGGSDELVSSVVATGGPRAAASAMDAHLDAGADHVCVQDIGPDPMAGLAAVASELSLNRG